MPIRLPGFISDVTLNPALSAGTNPTRKPIVLGVGDVKILVENEKVIRGDASGGADSLINTIFGSSNATRLAGVIRVGDSPNSADYAKTTDFVVTNSTIDWSPAGTEPTAGSEYYVTYYKSLSNFSITEYTSIVDIINAHGKTQMSLTSQYGNVTDAANVISDETVQLNGETVTALAHQNVSSVVVGDDAVPTTTYVLNTDYTLDAANGTIARIATGSISDGQTVYVDYTYASSTTVFEWANESTDAPVGTMADWSVTFVSGLNSGYTRTLSSYATGEFTVANAFPYEPAVGDVFLLVRSTPLLNTVVVGADLTLKNGASSVIVGQLDNNTSAWTDKLQPTTSEYNTALDTHLTTLRGYTEVPYYMVGMIPDDTAFTNVEINTNIHNTILSHVKLMSAPENRGERHCIAGYLESSGTKSTDITNFKSYAQTFGYERIAVVAPGDVEYTGHAGKTVNGSLIAACIAGKICSYTRISQSMLNETLSGVKVTANFFNRIEQRDLFASSVTIILDDNGVTKVVAGVTTDGSTADTQDFGVQAIADNIRKSSREEMEATFQGKPISSNTLANMLGKLTSILESKIKEQVIVDYDPTSIQITQDTTEPRQINVTASVSPLYNIWWGDLSFNFYI